MSQSSRDDKHCEGLIERLRYAGQSQGYHIDARVLFNAAADALVLRAPSSIAATEDVTAWLIKRPHGHGTEYLSIIEGPRFEAWTPSVAKAVRFPSKEAADQCLGKRRLPGFEDAEAKEHMWCTPSATTFTTDERKAGKYRLVYNKITKKIDRVSNFDGLAVESFDPPEQCEYVSRDDIDCSRQEKP